MSRGPATRFAFYFCLTYCLVEWIPLGLLLGVPAWTAGTLAAPAWWGTINNTVGAWTVANVLGLPGHSPPRLSANQLPLLMGMVTLAALSALVASVLTALDRGWNRDRLFAGLHLLVRFMLGSLLLFYGWHKVLPAQFPLTFDYLTLDVGDHGPRDLLWAFMAASRQYQVFAGVMEVAAGVLLLSRRTAMLGALLAAADIGNVVALDIAYDVPVKFLAAQMLLMTLFVLAPYARTLVDVLLRQRVTSPASLPPLFANGRYERTARVMGALVALWIVHGNFLAAGRQVDVNARGANTPLYGIWNVEEIHRDGRAVPLVWPDARLWRRFVVQSSYAAVVLPLTDSVPRWPDVPNARRFRLAADHSTRTLQLTPFPFTDATQPLAFGYEIPGDGRLILSGKGGEVANTVLYMRRHDPARYPLVGWVPTWRW